MLACFRFVDNSPLIWPHLLLARPTLLDLDGVFAWRNTARLQVQIENFREVLVSADPQCEEGPIRNTDDLLITVLTHSLGQILMMAWPLSRQGYMTTERP